MAKPDPRARIITHMNADHHDSLVRYLEHTHNIPSSTARHATLTDISLTSMVISTSKSSQYRIPFDPPLKDWSETRPRVVEMDHAAIQALGRDEITVKTFVPPQKAWHWSLLIGFVFTFVLLGRGRDALLPSSGGVTAPLKDRFPGFFEWLYKIQPWVFYPMVGAHIAETAAIDRRLRKHSVPRGSALWWKWVVSTFFGGFSNFAQLDALMARERKAKEAKKH